MQVKRLKEEALKWATGWVSSIGTVQMLIIVNLSIWKPVVLMDGDRDGVVHVCVLIYVFES